MAQTKEGAIKIAAKKIGISVDEYKKYVFKGYLWCTGCRLWHEITDFNYDKSRWSGHAQSCRKYLKTYYKKTYKLIATENRKKLGPLPNPERPGDKRQARHRVNVLVRTGKIPKPNDLACSDCGHIHRDGKKRHEYDHHKGYTIGKHLVVIPLCSRCHHKRHPMDCNKRKKPNGR